MKDSIIELSVGNKRVYMSLEELDKQEDWLRYKEYLAFKYQFGRLPVQNYDTFEHWKEIGSPKAGLWY